MSIITHLEQRGQDLLVDEIGGEPAQLLVEGTDRFASRHRHHLGLGGAGARDRDPFQIVAGDDDLALVGSGGDGGDALEALFIDSCDRHV